MLSTRSKSWERRLFLSQPLVGCTLYALWAMGFLFQWQTAEPHEMPGLSLVFALAGVGISIAYGIQACHAFFGRKTYVGLVASSRTLAIIRYRAPTLYIKRHEVASLLEEGRQVRLKDGRILTLECCWIGQNRYRCEFREPFYRLWGNDRPVLAGALRVAARHAED